MYKRWENVRGRVDIEIGCGDVDVGFVSSGYVSTGPNYVDSDDSRVISVATAVDEDGDDVPLCGFCMGVLYDYYYGDIMEAEIDIPEEDD